jgi:hypothetical protein
MFHVVFPFGERHMSRSEIDDGGSPSGDEWAEVVDEAAQLAAARDQDVPAPPPERSKGKILALLLVPLVAVVAWSSWTLTRPVPPLEPQVQEASLAGVIFVLSQQVERYRAEHGAYPASLNEVSPPLEGFTYRLEGDGYVLEATANGVALTYGSWEDAGGLLALAGSPDLEEIGR